MLTYIDIRSEKGYSYNFYQNYKDNFNDNIKIGNRITTPVAQNYSTNNWPIVFIDTPVSTSTNKNNIKISVRIDDNIKPVIFLENTALLGSNNRSKFIRENEILNGTTTGWSKDLMFQFPNVGNGSTRDNVAYYIKLNYFRQQYNPSSPNSILKNENYFDSAFCPINLPNIADNNYKLQQIHNHDINYVRGVLPNITKEFGYVADSGAFWDNERVLFYSQAIFTNNSSGIFYSKNKGIENKFSLKGSFFGLSFLKNDINISCKVLQESTGVNQFTSVKSITLSHYNGFPSAKESMLVLGIKSNELQSLIDAAKEINPSTLLPNLSSKHNQYLFIEEDSASPKIDKNGISFRKFKLKVQGFTPTGTKSIIDPVNDIYLYTKDGLCFTSKDFAASELVLIKEDLVSKTPFSNDKPENIINRLTTKNINVLEWNIYDKDGLPLVFAV